MANAADKQKLAEDQFNNLSGMQFNADPETVKLYQSENPGMSPQAAEQMARQYGKGNFVNKDTGETMSNADWTGAYKSSENAKQGLDQFGKPLDPEYNNLLDPASGVLKSQYQMTPEQANLSSLDSYGAYKSAAMAPGFTPWGEMQKQLLGTQQNQALSDLSGKSAQGQAQARSSLGMRGGLSSGARERLAVSGARDLNQGNQSIYNQGSQNLLNLGISDAQQKQSMLSNLLNTDVQGQQFNVQNKNQANQYNISNALSENTKANANNLAKYGMKMQDWAGAGTAAAIANSGGGGGGGSWVCTEINKEKPFTRQESMYLFGLRKYALTFHKDDAKYYFYEMKPLVDKMVSASFDFKTLLPWIDLVIAKSWERKFERAYKVYVEKILELATQFGMKNEKLMKIEEAI